MYLGINLHKRYAQVAVMDNAGVQAVIEATSNYYHVHDTLSQFSCSPPAGFSSSYRSAVG